MKSPSFLGVDRSLGGRRWRPRLESERGALAISQQLGVPDILGRVLAGRGIEPGDAEAFLAPRLRDLLPDPSHLLDMDKAVERIVAAINGGERIGIFGDYDVDGASSAALLAKFFAAIGREVTVYIPDRIKEGYGPNAPALMKLKEAGVSLVITVDCGTTAFAALDAAAEAGLEVIVVDHHVAEPHLPRAVAVVNPNRLDETSAVGQLCAAGVTFLLIVAVNRVLRQAFWYGEGHAEPNLMGWLDIVALATVADVVPLTGVNRALVRQGLAVMAQRGNAGLAALCDISRLDEKPEAWHLGFLLGPRVNAGGRVGEAGLGVRLLTATDRDEAAGIATRLDRYNEERREIESGVLDAAMAQAERQAAGSDTSLILVAGAGWHPGVIGIVAGRIKEAFNRPACVVSLDGGIGKGSGRSVRGVALGPAVIAAHQAGLLVNGGGHAMAAGFTVAEDRLEAFRDFLSQHIDGQLDGARLAPEIGIDGALSPEGATVDLITLLDGAGPYGAGNPRPRFVLPGVTPIRADIVGTDHVRCFLAAPEGGTRLKAIAFRTAGTPVGEALLNARGGVLHVAGHLAVDTWQGRRNPQFVIEDAARVV
ncbi:MAG: single-stranded-DNA-specific exonuclease RecJ [Rhodospirillaceae bacterium]